MKVISIDPGFERVGIAVIEKTNTGEKLIYSECFKTPASLPFNQRLLMIGGEINSVIKKHEPRIMAIETLFFTSNQKTAMGVAEARGVMVYQGALSGLDIREYTPLQIKIATTGYGKASKNQVMDMVKKLIHIKEKKEKLLDDEYDAIAIGLTCTASMNSENRKSK